MVRVDRGESSSVHDLEPSLPPTLAVNIRFRFHLSATLNIESCSETPTYHITRDTCEHTILNRTNSRYPFPVPGSCPFMYYIIFFKFLVEMSCYLLGDNFAVVEQPYLMIGRPLCRTPPTEGETITMHVPGPTYCCIFRGTPRSCPASLSHQQPEVLSPAIPRFSLHPAHYYP